MLFPSRKIAEACREFISQKSSYSARLCDFLASPSDNSSQTISSNEITLHIVLFPSDAFPFAKQFWQHTGLGISSRLADRCREMLGDLLVTEPLNEIIQSETSPINGPARQPFKRQNKHYSVGRKSPTNLLDAEVDSLHTMSEYVEERYGRCQPGHYATAAKRALRRRIAGTLVHDNHSNDTHNAHPLYTGSDSTTLKPSSRGVESVGEDDVFLYPTGMTSIWSAHQLALSCRPSGKSVCFGFPYTDTLKILQKWGPGCHFFGSGLDSDIDRLQELLEELSPNHTESSPPPILALFTEFPSNPLLRSPNLHRLRELADKYNFLIVVDDTIGNFINVSVLPLADIVVSSLTKVFSGDSNVMGGSLVLNPKGRHYEVLKTTLKETYEDVYFGEDSIFMERNSRKFQKRIKIINENAEAVCELLNADSRLTDNDKVIKDVYYPKYTTRENYIACRAADIPEDALAFGGLFSITFVSETAAHAFFDALKCHKGPSLGTSFTLACPYTVLAHYLELDWVQGLGVDPNLVRVSVGTEEKEYLLNIFDDALRAAKAVSKE